LVSLLGSGILRLDGRILHLDCLIVVLAALVIRGQDAPGEQRAFGLQLEFTLGAESGEAGGFLFGAFAAEALGFGEAAQGVFAGACRLGRLAFAEFGESPGFAGGEVPLAGESGLRLRGLAGGVLSGEARGLGGGLFGPQAGEFGLGAFGILLGLEGTEAMRLGLCPREASGFVLPFQRRSLLRRGETGSALTLRHPAIRAQAEEDQQSNPENEKNVRGACFHGL